jgi:hypothetical protein
VQRESFAMVVTDGFYSHCGRAKWGGATLAPNYDPDAMWWQRHGCGRGVRRGAEGKGLVTGGTQTTAVQGTDEWAGTWSGERKGADWWDPTGLNKFQKFKFYSNLI